MNHSPELEAFLVSVSDVLFPHLDPHPVDVMARSSDGDTPLHVAALRGDCYGIRLLLAAGAEVDAIGDMGCTPLYFAVMEGKIDAARLLLAAGADPDIVSELDFSPLSLAKTKGLAEMFRLLKQHRR